MVTHGLESAERGINQDRERKRGSEGHSHPGEGKGRASQGTEKPEWERDEYRITVQDTVTNKQGRTHRILDGSISEVVMIEHSGRLTQSDGKVIKHIFITRSPSPSPCRNALAWWVL